MLTLITGQPGNGKTLYTLQLVEEQRQKEQRAVYQSGIVGLSLPWLELVDAREWFRLPEGSIIVIDEAWKPFPVRKQGSQAPQYIEEFATHRHHGFDIYLITQHRHQIDTFVRKMVGRHIHLVRKFGAERARVFQWEKETDPSSEKEQETAIRTDWEYPREVYAWYRSAEVHTVKKDFPWRRFWWLPVLAVLVLVAGFYSYYRVRHMSGGIPSSAKPVETGTAATSTGGTVSAGVWTLKAGRARLQEVPGSAPRYDTVYKMAEAPHITGCMLVTLGTLVNCRCADQAGADAEVSLAECMSIVRHGVFDPSRKYVDSKEENIAYLNSARGIESSAAPSVPGAAGGAGATSSAPAPGIIGSGS